MSVDYSYNLHNDLFRYSRLDNLSRLDFSSVVNLAYADPEAKTFA